MDRKDGLPRTHAQVTKKRHRGNQAALRVCPLLGVSRVNVRCPCRTFDFPKVQLPLQAGCIICACLLASATADVKEGATRRLHCF